MYTYAIQDVERVVDGDTIIAFIDLGFYMFMREYIRLADVNAPEIRGINATPAGMEAKKFVEEWFAASDTLKLVSLKYDQREKYGRVLGQIFRDDDPVSLNEVLAEWVEQNT